MTLQEFTMAMNPLLNRFKRNYTGDVLDLIYTEVKNLTLGDFKRLVAHLNGTLRMAPMVPDVRKGIGELNIRPVVHVVPSETNYNTSRRAQDDVLYRLRDNIWANQDYIFIRGEDPKFIIKDQHPHNPLVVEDSQFGPEKLKEAKDHLAKGTYSQYVSKPPKIEDFKTPQFEGSP